MDLLGEMVAEVSEGNSFSALVEFTKSAVAKEWTQFSTDAVIEVTPICSGLVGGTCDYPVKCSKVIAQCVERWETALQDVIKPQADGDGTPPKLHLLFCSVNECASVIREHLLKIRNEVMKLGNMNTLYTIISTAAVIRNRLWYYSSIKSGDKKQDQLIHDNYKELYSLVEAFSQFALTYHTCFIRTSVLSDPQGNNWQNPKPLQEDDTCSYAVQCWWGYLQGVRADLWTNLPPRLAQKLLAFILIDSLGFLTSRYSQVQVTRGRMRQYRRDVSFILICCTQWILSVCNSTAELMQHLPVMEDHFVGSFHARAQALVSCLYTMCAPVPQVIKAMETQVLDGNCETDKGSWSWLGEVYPKLYLSGTSSLADLPPSSAVYLQVALLVSQPQPVWHMLLRALLMRNSLLPTVLLLHLEEAFPVQQKNWYVIQQQRQASCCGDVLCGVSSSLCSSDHSLYPQDVFTALAVVVCRASPTGGSLTDILGPSLGRKRNLDCMDQRQVWNAVRPKWYQAVVEVIESQLIVVAAEFLQYLQANFPDEYKNDAFLNSCLEKLLEDTTIMVQFLPPQISNLAERIQAMIHSSVTQPLGSSVLATIVVSCLFTLLNSEAKIKRLCPSLQAREWEVVLAVGERLCTLGEQYQEHLVRIHDNFGRWVVAAEESDIIDSPIEEVAVSGSKRAAQTLLSSPLGQYALQVLWAILRSNLDVIEGILGVPALTPIQKKNKSFVLPSRKQPHEFNPLKDYKLIGNDKVKDLEDKEFTWQSMVTGKVHILPRVLKHRWEVNDDEEDIEGVGELKQLMEAAT